MRNALVTPKKTLVLLILSFPCFSDVGPLQTVLQPLFGKNVLNGPAGSAGRPFRAGAHGFLELMHRGSPVSLQQGFG